MVSASRLKTPVITSYIMLYFWLTVLLQAWCTFTVVRAPPPLGSLEELADAARGFSDSISTDLRLGAPHDEPSTALHLGNHRSSASIHPNLGREYTAWGSDLAIGRPWPVSSSASRNVGQLSEGQHSAWYPNFEGSRHPTGSGTLDRSFQVSSAPSQGTVESPFIGSTTAEHSAAKRVPVRLEAGAASSTWVTDDTHYVVEGRSPVPGEQSKPIDRHLVPHPVQVEAPVLLDTFFSQWLHDPWRPSLLRLPPIKAYTRPTWLARLYQGIWSDIFKNEKMPVRSSVVPLTDDILQDMLTRQKDLIKRGTYLNKMVVQAGQWGLTESRELFFKWHTVMHWGEGSKYKYNTVSFWSTTEQGQGLVLLGLHQAGKGLIDDFVRVTRAESFLIVKAGPHPPYLYLEPQAKLPGLVDS